MPNYYMQRTFKVYVLTPPPRFLNFLGGDIAMGGGYNSDLTGKSMMEKPL